MAHGGSAVARALALGAIGCGAALVLTAGVLVWRDHRTIGAYASLASEASVEAQAAPRDGADEGETTRVIDWDDLRSQNPEVAAWVQVEGTDVDLPVVAPADGDMHRYLKTDFWGSWAVSGCPFLDDRSGVIGPHSMSYGHHMGNIGGMYSDLFRCFEQEEFDRLGTCHWYTPQMGCEDLVPLCALSVDEDYEPIQRFSFESVADMQAWLADIVSRADARAADAEALTQGAGHVCTLVTCSSIWANQPYRTLVLFVDVPG